MHLKRYEPCQEKTVFAIREQQRRSLISTFVVCCLDNMIPLVSISEISRLYIASMTAQASLRLSWSQILKTDFLMTRLCTVKMQNFRHIKITEIILKCEKYVQSNASKRCRQNGETSIAGAVWSGSALFAQIYHSQNYSKDLLQYMQLYF